MPSQSGRSHCSFCASVPNSMIDENRAPIRRFTTQGLYEITNLVNRLQKLADDISRIARALARDGARALINPGGGKIKE